MNHINPEDLRAGQILFITKVRNFNQGFTGKLFKVLAVDFPYGVLLWLESFHQTRYMEDLRSYDFAIPSQEYLEAAVPNEVWADTING